MTVRGWLRRVFALGALVLLGAVTQGAAAAEGWDFAEADEAPPTLMQLAKEQAPDLLLFAAFAALATTSFLRKSIPLKVATLVASVLYVGFWKSQLLSVVNVFALLAGNLPIFSHSMAWYAFAVFTAVTTVVWGRLYCGRICAYGAFTQLMDAVLPKKLRIDIPPVLERRAGYIKYAILLGAVAAFFATGKISFYRYIEPFWMFTLQASTVLWVGLGVLLLATVFVRNLYCRFLCPLGAFLGLVAAVTTLRPIKRWSECSHCQLCEKTCEWGAIRKRMIIKSECVRCDDCEILYDDKARCPHWLLIAKRARLKARQWVGQAGPAAP